MARTLKTIVGLGPIADALERERKAPAPDASFDSTWFSELVDLIAELVALPEDIPSMEQHDICSTAVFALAAAGVITADGLQSYVARQVASYRKQPKQRFIIATSVSLRYSTHLTARRINGWTITFHSMLPRRFDRSFLRDRQVPKAPQLAAQYTTVLISGSAATVISAFDGAMGAFDILRGIWNLSLNRGLWSQYVGGEFRSVNQITLGPIHTVHNPVGSPATKTFWFEPYPSDQSLLSTADEKFAHLARLEKLTRREIKRAKYSHRLEQLLIQYCRALDITDPSFAFLRLWAVLEALTSTERDRYDETIKRSLFLYEDPTLMAYVLELLRHRRNQATHRGENSLTPREDVIRLNRYVSRLFKFALAMGSEFNNLEDLARFLALPTDPEQLKKDIALRGRALKFRMPRP